MAVLERYQIYVFSTHQAARKLRAIRIDIQRQLDRIWPGAVINVRRFKQAHPDLPVPTPIVQSKPLEREAVRLLLEHCPNPYHVRTLGVEGLIALFHQHHARSLLSPAPIVAVYVAGLQQLLADETHWLQRQQAATEALATITLQTPARHLLSIRGLSPLWAAYYLDLVGYPLRFEWADQVWAFVGFDTVLDLSGDDNPQQRFAISRRGDPFYRHVLTWMASRWHSYWLAYRQHRANPKLHPHPGPWHPTR